MLKEKGFTPLLILVGILIVSIIAGGAYYLGKQTNPKLQPQNPVVISKTPQHTIVVSPTTDETVNWKTYTNNKYAVTFKYDTTSEVQESDQDNQLILRVFSKKLDFNRNYKGSTQPYQLAADNENFFTLEAATNKAAADSFGIGCSKFAKSNTVMVGGYQGYYSEGAAVQGGGQGYSKTICLEKRDFTYEFFTEYTADSPEETQKAVVQLFNQTLSTFKFTDKNQTTNISSSTVQILSLSPLPGPSGTVVTIKGQGFTPNNNMIKFFPDYPHSHFKDGSPINIIATTTSTDGQTLTFTVPTGHPSGIMCDDNNQCAGVMEPRVLPGDFPVSVTNSNGTSNIQNFSVTQ